MAVEELENAIFYANETRRFSNRNFTKPPYFKIPTTFTNIVPFQYVSFPNSYMCVCVLATPSQACSRSHVTTHISLGKIVDNDDSNNGGKYFYSSSGGSSMDFLKLFFADFKPEKNIFHYATVPFRIILSITPLYIQFDCFYLEKVVYHVHAALGWYFFAVRIFPVSCKNEWKSNKCAQEKSGSQGKPNFYYFYSP